MTTEKLGKEEIRLRLVNLKDWTVVDGRIHREFKFSNFVEAFGFMTQAAIIAESMNHHPDWSNLYNRVTVDLITHDAGGLSEKDFRLAEKMNALVSP